MSLVTNPNISQEIPNGATRVTAKAGVNGGAVSTVTVYTNGTGKTVKLVQSQVCCFNNTMAPACLILEVFNGGSVVEQMNMVPGANSSGLNGFVTHNPPVEVPNGYTVKLTGYDILMTTPVLVPYGGAFVRGYYV